MGLALVHRVVFKGNAIIIIIPQGGVAGGEASG